jgi:integrase
VSVLAYGGLRPGEALALTWADIGERSIQVDKALAVGEVKGTKTGKRRTIPIFRALAQNLAEWRLACGRPSPEDLVFPTAQGRPWSDHTYRNWRKRVFQPCAQLLGVHNPRPYDLRHSLASLLFAEGRDPDPGSA